VIGGVTVQYPCVSSYLLKLSVQCIHVSDIQKLLLNTNVRKVFDSNRASSRRNLILRYDILTAISSLT
jgi:hypothetical protein